MQPSVSTAGNLRMIALRRAIRCTPRARTIVTIAGRPSGMAATARLIPAKNIVKTCSPRYIPIKVTRVQTRRQIMIRYLPSCPSLTCSGVNSSFSLFIMRAISPMTVSMPVATTTALPRPRVTPVPIKAILATSARGISPPGIAPGSLAMGTDSPVRDASSISRLLLSSSLKSAGILSPASIKTMSPVSSSRVGTLSFFPSLSTRTKGEASFFISSRERSARYS